MDGRRKQGIEVDWKGCGEGTGNHGKGRRTGTSDFRKYQDGKGIRRFGMNGKFLRYRRKGRSRS